MSRFYPLKIKAIEKTTPACVVLTLEVPKQLQPIFAFNQGQHLTFKTVINGHEIRRLYSLCTSPLDNLWKVAIKEMENGTFSTFANRKLKPGDILDVMPPAGRFFIPVEPDKSRMLVAFAAGSGITPILSILKTHLEQEPNSFVTLFYANRTTASIILREEIEALKNRFLHRFQVYYFLTKERRQTPFLNGRINQQKLDFIVQNILPVDAMDEVFLCGPNEMIFYIKEYLLEQGLKQKKIHLELFNTKNLKTSKVHEVVNQDDLSRIRIKEGGRTFIVEIPKKSGYILDAALQNHVDLPFACKGGVCCTCRARLIEGEVDMNVSYGLEQEEIDDGYILTCQAVPLSSEISIDFEA